MADKKKSSAKKTKGKGVVNKTSPNAVASRVRYRHQGHLLKRNAEKKGATKNYKRTATATKTKTVARGNAQYGAVTAGATNSVLGAAGGAAAGHMGGIKGVKLGKKGAVIGAVGGAAASGAYGAVTGGASGGVQGAVSAKYRRSRNNRVFNLEKTKGKSGGAPPKVGSSGAGYIIYKRRTASGKVVTVRRKKGKK